MTIESPTIIYEDTDLLIVDKPAGMIVNRADTTRHVITLQEWIEKYLQLRPSSKEDLSDFYSRSGIVHRLDKDTSGLLIIAKNEESFLVLQKQFKVKVVHKKYLALAHGRVVPPEGEINVPVGRLPWNRKKFGVVVEGRESRTLYKAKEYLQLVDGKITRDFTLLELYPQTGRTHQIRVHLRYLGYPIVGDLLYAGRKNIQFDKKYLNRHFLHALAITFIHPTQQKNVTFESRLPQELQNFLNRLSPVSIDLQKEIS